MATSCKEERFPILPSKSIAMQMYSISTAESYDFDETMIAIRHVQYFIDLFSMQKKNIKKSQRRNNDTPAK